LKPALAIAVAWAVFASAARAGEARCWVDEGVLVVPASVMGVAGDYILDPATPDTELHETRAQGAGFVETALVGEVRIAGLTRKAHPVAVVDLDARTAGFPTPIAGVIGADLLRDYVLDVNFAPCRVGLHPAGEAPRFGAARRLDLQWVGGRPTIAAAVADGPRAISAPFALATGSSVAVRLDERFARVPGAPKPKELYPYGAATAGLRALSLADDLYENLRAGLLPAGGDASGPAGSLGAPVLARYRLRFDFPRGRLLLARAHEKGPPDAPGGP
jgi:hypothetical protein